MKSEECSVDKCPGIPADADAQRARREFLLKCGRLAAYTTPAVLLLLCGQNADANSGGSAV